MSEIQKVLNLIRGGGGRKFSKSSELSEGGGVQPYNCTSISTSASMTPTNPKYLSSAYRPTSWPGIGLGPWQGRQPSRASTRLLVVYLSKRLKLKYRNCGQQIWESLKPYLPAISANSPSSCKPPIS